MPPSATRIPRPPATAKLTDVRVGVCPACGTLNAVYTDSERERTLWVMSLTKGIKVVEATDHSDAPCAVCVGTTTLAFPKNQDLISAALSLGGFDAVQPSMITERGLRALYRAHRTVADALWDAAKDMGSRRRKR